MKIKKIILIVWYTSLKLKEEFQKILGNYQNLTDLFINLRNVNVNPREGLKI